MDLCRYGTEDFGQDVVFAETPGATMELVEQADIVHFHNYLDLDNTQFSPIDFRVHSTSDVATGAGFRTHQVVVWPQVVEGGCRGLVYVVVKACKAGSGAESGSGAVLLKEKYPAICRQVQEEQGKIWWGDETGIRSDHQTGMS